MSEALWLQVDQYFERLLPPQDDALEHALRSSVEAGLPQIHVSPLQGRFLELLVRAVAARRVLEIGTLAGYSTICMARALPADGHLITLELDPRNAALAQQNLQRANVAQRVEIRVGPALASLEALARQPAGPPFDLVFIDADKPNIPAYLAWSLKLARPGALLLIDNVVREGQVLDPDSSDASVQGVRRFVEQLQQTQALATVLQTVGAKGYDGFAMMVVGAAAPRD